MPGAADQVAKLTIISSTPREDESVCPQGCAVRFPRRNGNTVRQGETTSVDNGYCRWINGPRTAPPGLPRSFEPHAQTVPSARRAKLCPPPAATSIHEKSSRGPAILSGEVN